ncbi:MAG: 3-hydroxyisobutyrate dehydrogenase [Pseudomonadota bacterium]
MAKIAVIGLGNMGGPMAGNLVKAGHAVTGFDLAPAAIDAARGRGVVIAETAAEAVSTAEIVVTMLPSGKHVVAATEGLFAASPKGTLFIDSSTIDVASARVFHEAGRAAGHETLDAPVSGGVGGAEGATLTFMCGGTPEAFAKAQPVLAQMGKKIVHCGDAGAGQAAKICNNMILGISMIGVCEAFVLGEKLGLSHQALYDVASTSSGQCWSLTSYCPVPGPLPASPANRGYAPGFAAALMLKDLNLSQEAAGQAGATTALGAAAAELYAAFSADGNAGKDFSGIIEWIRTRAG